MRRLYWASLLFIALLLASCTTSTAALPPAGASADESLGILAEAYQHASGTREIVYNYAFALISQGDGERALEVTEEYLSENPQELRFLMLKAYIQRTLYHMESYLNTLNEILLLDPANVTVRLERAKYYESRGNSAAAVQDAKTILTYDIKNSDALELLSSYDPFYAALSHKVQEEVTEELLKPNPLVRPEITEESFDFAMPLEEIGELTVPTQMENVPLLPVQE